MVNSTSAQKRRVQVQNILIISWVSLADPPAVFVQVQSEHGWPTLCRKEAELMWKNLQVSSLTYI